MGNKRTSKRTSKRRSKRRSKKGGIPWFVISMFLAIGLITAKGVYDDIKEEQESQNIKEINEFIRRHRMYLSPYDSSWKGKPDIEYGRQWIFGKRKSRNSRKLRNMLLK